LHTSSSQELLLAEPPASPPDLFLPSVDRERARQREEKALRVRSRTLKCRADLSACPQGCLLRSLLLLQMHAMLGKDVGFPCRF
jgi:hypothetical protein